MEGHKIMKNNHWKYFAGAFLTLILTFLAYFFLIGQYKEKIEKTEKTVSGLEFDVGVIKINQTIAQKDQEVLSKSIDEGFSRLGKQITEYRDDLRREIDKKKDK